jgi:XTP/dITP diphosphohydrolase
VTAVPEASEVSARPAAAGEARNEPKPSEVSAGRRMAGRARRRLAGGRAASRAHVVVATSSPAKLREIRALLAPLPVPLVGLDAFPRLRLPPEGDDYAANAIAKARAAAAHAGRPALADDSGLEVEGLGGAPGPRSARYGGPGLDDAGRVARLLAELAGREGAARRARFVCVAALALPDGEVATARGECRGRIVAAPRGRRGFGYDPVFEPEGRGRTMAELPAEEKNRISHRARAFRALRAALLAYATGSARSRRS